MIRIGDAKSVVAEISLDRDSLDWLANTLPQSDEFTKELRRALKRVEEQERCLRDMARPEAHLIVTFRK